MARLVWSTFMQWCYVAQKSLKVGRNKKLKITWSIYSICCSLTWSFQGTNLDYRFSDHLLKSGGVWVRQGLDDATRAGACWYSRYSMKHISPRWTNMGSPNTATLGRPPLSNPSHDSSSHPNPFPTSSQGEKLDLRAQGPSDRQIDSEQYNRTFAWIAWTS